MHSKNRQKFEYLFLDYEYYTTGAYSSSGSSESSEIIKYIFSSPQLYIIYIKIPHVFISYCNFHYFSLSLGIILGLVQLFILATLFILILHFKLLFILTIILLIKHYI